jgi:hypothetical protein
MQQELEKFAVAGGYLTRKISQMLFHMQILSVSTIIMLAGVSHIIRYQASGTSLGQASPNAICFSIPFNHANLSVRWQNHPLQMKAQIRSRGALYVAWGEAK